VKRYRFRRWLGRVGLYASVILLVSPAVLFFLWMLSLSLKNELDNTAYPPVFIPHPPTLANFVDVFEKNDFLTYTINSVIVSFSATGLALLLGVPAGYGIAKAKATKAAALILVARVTPGLSYLIPLFLMFQWLGMIGTLTPLVITHLVITVPIVVWVMIGFFEGLPGELEEAALVGGKLVVKYLVDAKNQLLVFDLDGKRESEITLPALGTVDGLSGNPDRSELFYSFASFLYPTAIYRYDVSTGQNSVFQKPNVNFDPDRYETKQIFYASKDGTRIPMFIVCKKGLELAGNSPVFLTGYGGFNISMTPSFTASCASWIEKGGVFALPNLRGGGEYGRQWHESGIKEHKQNVFDDFISAAQALIDAKYTKARKIAIVGGSNGGLLVGAALTQRPDLFGAAVAQVGVLDMLRFHKFTIGWAWESDYGSSDTPDGFQYLFKYSPLHHIKEGACYPPILVTTGDHDDRVVPGHSFKFVATLQAAQQCANPVLIRIETKAGHGAGKSISKIIAEESEVLAFLWNATN